MKTILLPFDRTWHLLLAPPLLLLACWPSKAQQPPRLASANLTTPFTFQVSPLHATTRNLSSQTTTTEFQKDALFINPSFEGVTPPVENFNGMNPPLVGWNFCAWSAYLMPKAANQPTHTGSSMTPADGQAYVGLNSAVGYSGFFGQNLRTPLKAGVTYTFLVDVAYAHNFRPQYKDPESAEVPITLQVKGSPQVCSEPYRYQPAPGAPLWSKVIPTTRISWQTDTVIITPTTDVARLEFEVTGTRYVNIPNPIDYYVYLPGTQGTVLLDNLRTLTGLVLQKTDGTAQAAGKPFHLLWQPILSAGDLDSLAQPQLRGTVRTFQGGRVPLPANLRVTDARGFYFFQEATPAAGQDTLYYGLYVRNTPLPNGVKDDTLRHLYQCRRTFGSQAGLLGDSLAPLALGSPYTAPSVAPADRAAPAPRSAAVRTGHFPNAPQRPAGPLTGPRPALPAPRQGEH
ncbi:hypothetical protein IC235_21430 [Hymenobacter sp. BT664]|uniref:Uncharacterized protein n=1 Tax=Hymenobacter montanus TaxID=2771359 RepID=A0A927GLF6_9BACT|nr:hypothetical protein [Hymenobacter montanus]MBD2770455.1 hypothetical protein [Hymenobacter montanus]